MVAFEAVGEGVQVGQVVGAGGGDPGVEAFAGLAGYHLRERLHVMVQGIQVGADRQDAVSWSCSPVPRLPGRRRIQLVM